MLQFVLLVVLIIYIVLTIGNLIKESKHRKYLKTELEKLILPEEIKIKLIGGGKMPERKTDGAVGFDCYARLGKACAVFEPTCRGLIPLGFAMELPEGYEAVIRPRSGLSKKGIDETIGTIDFDYRGEVMACVVNNSKEDFRVYDGDRICQIVIREVPKVKLIEVSELSKTERGEGGFGHTGI